MDSFIRKIILFFLLLDNLYLPINLGFDFRVVYLVYLFYSVYTVLTNKKVLVNKNVITFSVLFVIVSLTTSLIKQTPITLVVKQTILIYISLLVSYILINHYKFSLQNLFKDYIKLIYFASIIGLLQLISQNIGFTYGATFNYLGFDKGYYKMLPNSRIQSWFYEPSFLVYAFMPVVFIAVCRFFKLTTIISLSRALIIVVVFLLSRSSIGYLGLLIAFIIVTTYKYSILKNPRVIGVTGVLFLLLSYSIYKIPDVKFRVDDTVKLFFDTNISGKDIDAINLSTYAFFSNYKITLKTLKNNPFIGTGLGTYEYNYDKYLTTEIPQSSYRKFYKINRSDANSMLFRLLAEVGFLGVLIFMYLLFRTRIKLSFDVKHTQQTINLWMISNSIFVLILIRLLRQGHYTMLGFTLFLLMYFYAYKQFNERVKEGT